MKKILFFVIGIFCANIVLGQWVQNGTTLKTSNDIELGGHKLLGLGLHDKFTYNGMAMGHYALRWGPDPWNNAEYSMWLSAYGGLRFFTAGRPRMSVDKTVKVGLGTVAPVSLLHLHDSKPVLTMTYTEGGFAAIRGNDGVWLFGYGGKTGYEDVSIGTQSGSGYRTLALAAGGQARLKILANGNVGIGTVNPDALLTVKGVIKATEVKIEATAGADFVFDEDYKLPSLNEVESFIKENKHLPTIPSEKEMKEKGLNMSEFQIKLLQKIEELTLYVIAQDKKIESLEQENKDIKKELRKNK